MDIPQPISDALQAALTSKAGLDTATTAETTTAQALVTATAADQTARAALDSAKTDLSDKVKALQAAVVTYFPVA
jgi:hypothetical protein